MQSGNIKTRNAGTIPLPRLMVWASPAGALAALGLPIAMFLPNYYIENLGLAPAVTGLVFLLLRLWDGITDPLIGALSDRINPPLGRRRFWVVLSAPILVLSVWMVMVPPDSAGALHLGGWLMLLYVGLTALQVNHISWGAELAPSYDARARLMGWYQAFVIGGLLILLTIAAALEIGTSSDLVQAGRGDTLRAMALFLVIALPTTILLAAFFVPEGEQHAPADIDVRAMFATLSQSPGLRNVLGVNLLYRFSTGVTATLFLWYAQLKLDLGGFAAAAMALYFLSGLIGMPILMRLTARFGKKGAYRITLFIGALLALPFGVLDGTNEATNILGSFNASQLFGLVLICLSGALYGAGPYLARAMIADVADEEHLRTGTNRNGLLFALLSFSEKLGFALAVGVATLMLVWIGLETGPQAQPTEVSVYKLGWVYAIIPALSFGIAIIWLSRYHITRAQQAETRAMLLERGLVQI